jgi:uncharacterized membrane protein
MGALSLWAGTQLPPDARIAVHWGADGKPNGYAGLVHGLVVVPAVALALTGVFAFLPCIEPRREHLRLSAGAYETVWIGVLMMLAGMHALIVSIALGAQIDIVRIVMFLLGALWVVIGNQLGRVRSNFFLGIRTPWTLSDDRVWDRTHRFAGWALVLTGLVVMSIAAMGVADKPGMTLAAGLMSSCVALVVFRSYQIWKELTGA